MKEIQIQNYPLAAVGDCTAERLDWNIQGVASTGVSGLDEARRAHVEHDRRVDKSFASVVASGSFRSDAELLEQIGDCRVPQTEESRNHELLPAPMAKKLHCVLMESG